MSIVIQKVQQVGTKVQQVGKQVGTQVADAVKPERLFLSVNEVNKIFNPSQSQRLGSSRKVAPAPIDVDEESGEPNHDDDDNDNDTTTSQPQSHAYETFENTIHQMFETFVGLPQRASHTWEHLPLLLLGITFGSALFYMLVYFLPLNSVNEGLDYNRIFQYGIMTYYEFIALLTWVATCNYAMPKNSIPLKSSFIAVAVGLSVEKLFDVFVSESLWNLAADPVFPMPFSTIVSGTVALPFALGTLYARLPNKKDESIRSKFRLCVLTVFLFVVSYIIALLWAAVFQHLAGTYWQKAWAVVYSFLLFFCKSILVAPAARRLNPERFVYLQFVVGMIFARVQVATLPYIDGYWTLIFLVLPKAMTLLFRFYAWSERFGIVGLLVCANIRGETETAANLQEHFGATSSFEVTLRCFRSASVSDIHNTSIYLANVGQPCPEWDVAPVEAVEAMSTSLFEDFTVNDDDDNLAQMEEGRAPVRALDNIEEVTGC